MRIDFDLDEGTAAKLMMGLGDEALPAVSLFAPPMVDYHTAATAKVGCWGFWGCLGGGEEDGAAGGWGVLEGVEEDGAG
jgi:hypothetical protein